MNNEFLEKCLKEGTLAYVNISEELIKEFKEEKLVTLGLFNGLLEKSSTFFHLYNNNHLVSLDCITRPIIENYLYLKYILNRDSQEEKNYLASRSYLFKSKMREIETHLSRIAKNNKGEKLRRLFSDITIEELEHNYSEEEALRDKEELRENFKDILSLRSEKDKWYDIDEQNKKSFEQLCFYMDFESEYEHFYRAFSKEIHSSDVIETFDFTEEEFNEFFFIKSGISLNLISNFIMETVISYYRWNNLIYEADKFKEMMQKELVNNATEIDIRIFDGKE
ncbi:DUF5677 domain-containing protein [Salipaludibacillus daqingensis]|uniref:DUF5677 domain-containing protein n=1 Tax=Salipaludibacillus daqingensis TaxID=3041001 RepID=UPI0024766E84|nr:DUF5677 domain-containing protein [Salipaludibacillus daqingensis]